MSVADMSTAVDCDGSLGDNKSKENTVCIGDSTTCLECGKTFTHPFYFGTHISTHTSEKGFLVAGQCNLCGLVFSDETIFAAHMSSSQLRLEAQNIPEDYIGNEFQDADQEQSLQNDPHLGADYESAHVENNEPATSTHSNEVSSSSLNTNDEQKPKRKRKAPDRFDPTFELQSTPKLYSDLAVEAYMLSLEEMGFTVDRATSSNHKSAKSAKKGSGKGRGKGRGKKEDVTECDLDSSADTMSLKAASPKYEYLDDDDDSLDDEPEVIIVSGKSTRGERLQQRKERLSQIAEQFNVDDIKEVFIDDVNDEVVDYSRLSSVAGHLKKISKTEVPVSPGVKNEISTPLHAANVGTNNKFNAESSVNKSKTFTSQPPIQGNKASSFGISNVGNKNSQHVNSQTCGVGNRANLSSSPAGHCTLGNFQEQHIGEKNINMNRNPGNINLDTRADLEQSKRGSRENVQEMLQSVGMIAVTSSSLAQGKRFPSQADVLHFSSNNRVGMICNPKQTNHPNGRFRNPQSMTRSVGIRGGANASGHLASNQRCPHNHHKISSPQTVRNNSNNSGFYPQGSNSNRGRCIHTEQQRSHNMVGTAASGPNRVLGRPVANSSQPSRGYKTTVSNTSNEIIVIDEDEDDDIKIVGVDEVKKADRTVVKNGVKGPASCIHTQKRIQNPLSRTINKGKDNHSIEDSKSEIVCINVDDDKIPHSPVVKVKGNVTADHKSDNKDDNNSDDGLNDNIDIMPGEDIDGWKVCLAENSDSEDDSVAQSSNKISSDKLPLPNGPQQLHSSSLHIATPQQEHSLLSKNSLNEVKPELGTSLSPLTDSNQVCEHHCISSCLEKNMPKNPANLEQDSAVSLEVSGSEKDSVVSQIFDVKSDEHLAILQTNIPSSDKDLATSECDMPSSGQDVATSECDIPSSGPDLTNSQCDMPNSGQDLANSQTDKSVKAEDNSYQSLTKTDNDWNFQSNNYSSPSQSLKPDENKTSDRENMTFDTHKSLVVGVQLEVDGGQLEADGGQLEADSAQLEANDTQFDAGGRQLESDGGQLKADEITDNKDSSGKNKTSELTSLYQGKVTEETEPLLSSSVSLCLPLTLSSDDVSKCEDSNAVANSEFHTKVIGLNPSSPTLSSASCSTNNLVTDLISEPHSSHFVTSQISATSTDFLKGDSSLFDIFTEIEKTCKEMEKNSENGEKEHQLHEETNTLVIEKKLSDDKKNVEEAMMKCPR